MIAEIVSSQGFEVQARQTGGEWETVCADTIEAAAQATASYIARRYEVETRVVIGGAPSETKKPAKKAYDPGVPTVPTRLTEGTYSVPSFRAAADPYTVSLAGQGSCSCPHWTQRLEGTGLDCKHLKAARIAEWNRAAERAALVSDHALPMLLEKYEQAGNLTIALALRAEQITRQQVGA